MPSQCQTGFSSSCRWNSFVVANAAATAAESRTSKRTCVGSRSSPSASWIWGSTDPEKDQRVTTEERPISLKNYLCRRRRDARVGTFPGARKAAQEFACGRVSGMLSSPLSISGCPDEPSLTCAPPARRDATGTGTQALAHFTRVPGAARPELPICRATCPPLHTGAMRSP